MSSEATLNILQSLAEPADVSQEHMPACMPPAVDVWTDTSSSLSDEKLIEAVGKGDKAALGVLFQRHGRSVLNVARRILRDEVEADDLRQDVFLYLFERAQLYDAQKSSAVSWIMQITYHRAFNRRKFLSLRQGSGVEVFDEQHIEQSTTQPSTDRIDGQAILGRLADQLSPTQQQTLHLHFFEGYTLREIAEQSGQAIGNVRHHYYRALDTLRSNLFPKKRG
ncbi:RNA polymerase sigma factor [Terriglobus tenax]|uniref:RNA polymerase sigma factor n=1 Tax=Terriglobus tenax TaxID=1111115 RepID=UPI0021E06CEF|nr:sigma-70 family RNA polymerase sigma factor [Terriglobus tenax]